MRKFAKISAVLAAMVLALAFVGCKDDDDDDDDPSVVTTWTASEEAYKGVVTFYDNGTFKANISDEEGGFSETGKYSGDTTKYGAIVIFHDDGETETIIIETENGKAYFDSYKYTYFKQ